MSRIGNMPITVPSGVTVTIDKENLVTVKGPKGELKQQITGGITVKQEEKTIVVARPSDQKEKRSLHGLYRALINNMIIGVSNGFEKTLEIIGVGYRAQKQGEKLVLNLGYSHPVEVIPPKSIQFDVPAQNKIIVKGIDKQLVGLTAADIRKLRKPEPYKGKGIRYEGEYVRHKEGKTGK